MNEIISKASPLPGRLSYFCAMNFDKQLFHLVDEALQEDVGDGDHSHFPVFLPMPEEKRY